MGSTTHHVQAKMWCEDHKPIIFDRVLKAGNSVLLAAKMVIKNPEEVNAAIVNGKQSKEYFHRVTGHAGHHLMDATAKYYKVDLTGKVNNCLICSLEKIRQKNIPKKNEDKSKNPGERIYLDISSMRKPSMGGSQTTASEPVAARTRQARGTSPEMSAFADVKDDKTLNEWLHEIAFVTSTMSDPDEPQSFQEAWWVADLISREKWREAIRLEFKKMLDIGVWRHVKRNDRPNDRRLVGCRWVFKV